MVKAIVLGLLVSRGGKTFQIGKTDDSILGVRWIFLHRKGDKIKYYFGSLFLKLGLFRSDGLTSLALLGVTNIGLFYSVGRPAGAWRSLALVLNLEELCNDSLVHRGFHQLRERREARVSTNTLYFSAMP